jgi:hypothetical protein
MPNVKISELPEITVLDDADEVIINDTAASTTKRGSVENLRTALLTRETIAIEGTDTGAAVTIEASSATGQVALAVNNTTRLAVTSTGVTVTGALNMGSGNITSVGTVDGRDVSVDGAKLDGIEAGADVTDAANVAAAGALMADGSVPATGDLDMDGNSILNVSLTIAAPLELADVAGATLIELDGDTDGIMEIRAGRVRMAPESGAALELRGSDQSAGGGAGVTVRGGNGSSFGGSALVYGGNGGTGVGGAAAVVGGTSADDVGGYVEIYGGEGDTVGGSVTIGGGFCDTGTNGDGGDVEINGGASDGSGTDGTIKIGTVTTAAIESGPAPWAHDGNLVVDGELLGRAGIEIDSGTSISMTDAKSGKTVRCTAGTAVTISAGGSAGCTVEYLQEGAGQLEVVAPAGTLRLPATFVAKTAEQWSSVVVTCLDSNEWLVRGDLEPS